MKNTISQAMLNRETELLDKIKRWFAANPNKGPWTLDKMRGPWTPPPEVWMFNTTDRLERKGVLRFERPSKRNHFHGGYRLNVV